MARKKMTVNTAAYRRTHGYVPLEHAGGQARPMWAFTLDGDAARGW